MSIELKFSDFGITKDSIEASLPEAKYEATILRFERQDNKDAKFLINMIFTVPGTTQEQKLAIWPARAEWMIQQLVDKAGLEKASSPKDLVGKTVDLWFTHKFFNKVTGKYQIKKAWNLYDNTIDEAEVPATDTDTDNPENPELV
jgi:hypothetical protein